MADKIGFLREDNGNVSSARIVFMVGSLWTMGITSYLATQGVDVPVLIAFFSAVEGVWVGLKLGQKPMEENIKRQ